MHPDNRANKPSRSRGVLAALSAVAAGLLCFSASASALEVIDYFGTEFGGGDLGGQFDGARALAVNSTGAGAANPGDVYVLDNGKGGQGGRVQRFAYDDNGTPAEPYDDSYDFVSAWGADVVQSGKSGDEGDAEAARFELCTAAAECQAAALSTGNGTVTGNGSILLGTDVAVDQDTGYVYVLDANGGFIYGNPARVNVYDGVGTFLYSFGYDVDATSPGTGYEVCPAVDVCKGGVKGSGVGQILNAESLTVSPSDGSLSIGTLFVADYGNHRVETYDLDGSNPSSFGSAADFPTESQIGSGGPSAVAIDSKGVVYLATRSIGIARYDSQDANGGGVGFLPPIGSPPLVLGGINDLTVDADLDGVGPEEDVLYVLSAPSNPPLTSQIESFGPLNDPGQAAPPTAADALHGSLVGFGQVGRFGVDDGSGRLFVTSNYNGLKGNAPLNAPPDKHGVYVLGPAGVPPTVSIESADNVGPTSATVEGTINPNGGPLVSHSVEYSRDGVNWSRTTKTPVGTQTNSQAVSSSLDPTGTGLEPNTTYHVRLLASKEFVAPVASSELTFETDAEAPRVETVGSPIRAATSARLEGRLNPRNASSTYRFEYIPAAVYEANLAASEPPFTGAQQTTARPAGSGGLVEFASDEVEGLQPGTAYRYRVVGSNIAGSSAGESMTVTTRASDASLEHGHLPGPPGSDRAYEQVSVPDSGGNPVYAMLGFADSGDRALYRIAGGTPLSDTGSFGSVYYAERSASGWHTRAIAPPRSELFGGSLGFAGAREDLDTLAIENVEIGTAGAALWRLNPATSPSKLFETAPGQEYAIETGMLSADGTRAVALLTGDEVDPAYPNPGSRPNLYNISTDPPRLISPLPDGAVPACGVATSGQLDGFKTRQTTWLTADGSFAFFPSQGNTCSISGEAQLYVRDLEHEQTLAVSGPSLSGVTCGASFLRATADAGFFWTQSRLTEDDTPSIACGNSAPGGDIYRYDTASDSLECVTCVLPGLDADVPANPEHGAPESIAVPADGARVYFTAGPPLVPGAPEDGTYRIRAADGDLAYVGPAGVGMLTEKGSGMNSDGSVLVFRSADPGLDQLGGSENGGKAQYYRYDDGSRSLICVSCPQGGSAPSGAVPSSITRGIGIGPNTTPLSDDGTIFAFGTPTSLLGPDQNTVSGTGAAAGTDLYEWRDGRLLLLTDGLASWAETPEVAGVSASGRDVYFRAPAQYTPDALDGYQRLYDARIGGGFEFPAAPPPCPLEVCQGTPKGAPAEQPPGTSSFTGPRNTTGTRKVRRCPKGKRRVRRKGRVRCVRRHARRHKRVRSHKRRHRPNHNRRNAR